MVRQAVCPRDTELGECAPTDMEGGMAKWEGEHGRGEGKEGEKRRRK